MKVLIAENIVKEAIELLVENGHEVDVNPTIGEQELLKTIGDYHAIMVRSKPKITKEVIEAGGNLRVIGRVGVGLDNIDLDAAKTKGIKVVNSPEASTLSVAEHAIGLMLALARKIPSGDKSLKDGRWDRKKFMGNELHDKTLGIVGFGRIGRSVSKIARGLGMELITYDPFITSEDADEYDCECVSFDHLLANSDVITLHVPAISETTDMINKETLSKMKKTALLVNTARGAIVNEEDLYDALNDGVIAGAALDVYKIEPPEGTPLAELDNIVLTPHLAASTKEAQVKAGTIVAEKIVSALRISKAK